MQTLQAIEQNSFHQLIEQLRTVFVGKDATLTPLLTALLCQGHILLEDMPGLGKTTLAKALAKSLSLSFKRIQCTPDLMPSDILGGNIYQPQNQDFKFIPGPIFTNVLLVDEINRASPRTQSAFLEAMAEGTVTIDRKTANLPQPFLLIATQNPIEFAGTFPLPEAQLDRFFIRLSLGYPNAQQALTILQNHMGRSQGQEPIDSLSPIISKTQLQKWQQACQHITLDSQIQRYIVALTQATQEHKDVRIGISPRGAIALMRAAQAQAFIEGQNFVTPQHVQTIAPAVLTHRLILRNHTNAEQSQKTLQYIMANVPVPGVALEKEAPETAAPKTPAHPQIKQAHRSTIASPSNTDGQHTYNPLPTRPQPTGVKKPRAAPTHNPPHE